MRCRCQGARRGSAHRRRRLTWLWSIALTVALVGNLLLAVRPVAAAPAPVYALDIQGVVSQLAVDHALRVLAQAEANQAAALVIQINSPGGVEAATRRLAQAVLAAKIPVLVYVGPGPDAEALSGAMFVVLAANVAAMETTATIGAGLPAALVDHATPDEREARIARALQIAAATAEARGRPAATLIQVVQEERALGATEALSDGIIDRVSRDIPTLLEEVDGERVRTAAGSVTLETRGAPVIWAEMTLRERLLQSITDPNVAYVLFSLGVLLLIVALYAPGGLVAAVPGIVAVVTAVIAFGNLPVSLVGLALLVLGALLFIGELYRPRVGVLGALGVAAYLAGSFSLYQPVRQDSPFAPAVAVNPWVAVGTVCFFVIALLLVLRLIFRAEQRERAAAARALIGREGITLTALNPRGTVRVLAQEWPAETAGDAIPEDAEVVVRDVTDGSLRVEPLAAPIASRSPHDPD